MKKYRTKNHGYLRDGLIFDEQGFGRLKEFYQEGKYYLDVQDIKNHPTWFEEIDSRWKPEKGEKFYMINLFGLVDAEIWCESYSDEKYWEFGLVFKNLEEAEQARDKVKALLLSLHTESKCAMGCCDDEDDF